MTAFARRVAEITGTEEDRLERLAGGDLSEVLLVNRPDGRWSVAKASRAAAAEASMLRAIAGAGVKAPAVEGEHGTLLLLQYVENDGRFDDSAWADIGAAVRRLHDQRGESYGWPVDYSLGTVELDNRRGDDWPAFWGERRLLSVASVLDLPWRRRVERAAERMGDLLPERPPPSLLHGDLWQGNILVRDGALAALIDPACYHGDAEVDLAMLGLFGSPPPAFRDAYGPLAPGWRERRAAYQLFPALVHLRLFGRAYAAMADGLLRTLGA